MTRVTLGDLALYNIYKLLLKGDKDATYFVLTQKGFEDKSVVSVACDWPDLYNKEGNK